MQNAEVLIKVIIPAILLVFWALSSLFNKERTQAALKERQASLAGRPNPFQAQRPPDRRIAPGPGYRPQGKDEVMVIRGEPTRPPSRQPQPVPRRAANKGRNSGPPGRRPVDAPAPRNRELLGGNISADVNQALTRPIEMSSLSESFASDGSFSGTASVSSSSAAPFTAAAIDLRATLADPRRVREAFVLNEILQPPVSQRARRH